MAEQSQPFDVKVIEAMNEKAIQNQFFTPDNVYLELGLFKDFSIGAVYMEHIVIKQDEEKFNEIQTKLLPLMRDYQKRVYDTVEPFFEHIGYLDRDVDAILSKKEFHDYIFMLSPVTKFLQTIVRHTVRNQNHSRPANKYEKKKIDDAHYVMEAVDLTYRINTYPLTLSEGMMLSLAKELGEALGVNIAFMNKNPTTFDEKDWDEWMEAIDCFYLDDLGRFNRSPFILKKQGEMQFAGCYFFARKRFERCVIADMRGVDFDQQIQIITSRLGMFCDFEWLQNNDVRLTEEAEDVPMNDDQASPDTTPDSGTQ